MLQAHRIARRQRDAANAAREALAEAGSSRWGGAWADDRRFVASASATNVDGAGERRVSTTGLPAALREFVSPERTASFRSFINERNRENERRNQLQQEPSRRSSMLLVNGENPMERETLGTSRNGNDASSNLERLTLAPSRLQGLGSTTAESSNNPWAEIDALYRSRFPVDPPADRTARLRIEVEDEDRTDFAHRLRQPWRPLDEPNQAALDTRNEAVLARDGSRAESARTVGCSWSENGTIL